MYILGLNFSLEKLVYKISSNAFSRPEYQVKLLVDKLKTKKRRKLRKLLDVGGGPGARFRPTLEQITDQYLNLEIKKDSQVNIVGSVYKIPLPNSSVDAITLFMVLEHLNKPLEALQECQRVLSKRGYLLLTTVQYWHTHNHPSDYFRYTRAGLEYLCKEAGFKIIDIWSLGGPFLIIFQTIELNLPGKWRSVFSLFFYRFFDYLDWIFFSHEDKRENSDSLGWVLIARRA